MDGLASAAACRNACSSRASSCSSTARAVDVQPTTHSIAEPITVHGKMNLQLPLVIQSASLLGFLRFTMDRQFNWYEIGVSTNDQFQRIARFQLSQFVGKHAGRLHQFIVCKQYEIVGLEACLGSRGTGFDRVDVCRCAKD